MLLCRRLPTCWDPDPNTWSSDHLASVTACWVQRSREKFTSFNPTKDNDCRSGSSLCQGGKSKRIFSDFSESGQRFCSVYVDLYLGKVRMKRQRCLLIKILPVKAVRSESHHFTEQIVNSTGREFLKTLRPCCKNNKSRATFFFFLLVRSFKLVSDLFGWVSTEPGSKNLY